MVVDVKQTAATSISSDTTTSAAENENQVADCMSCRVIGSSVCFAGSAYVVYNTVKLRSQYRGWRFLAFLLQGASLTSGTCLSEC